MSQLIASYILIPQSQKLAIKQAISRVGGGQKLSTTVREYYLVGLQQPGK